ncbi:MAG: hypothetical protein ACLPTJ_20385 [Solirubrobacteraceae bacterium]
MNAGRSRSSRRMLDLLGLGCALLVVGCGGSSAPAKPPSAAHRRAAAPTLCEPNVRDAITRFLKVPTAKITATESVGNDAEPQCTFVTHVAGGRRISVTANVGVEVGAYFILERTEVEASQMFAPTRLSPAPQAVPRLGLEADWFPAETHLMATDGTRLVTTTVIWRGAGQARKTALATVVTRPYLKTPHGKAAIAKAEGYPSG